jgi:hypothetical protein
MEGQCCDIHSTVCFFRDAVGGGNYMSKKDCVTLATIGIRKADELSWNLSETYGIGIVLLVGIEA